MTPEFNLIKQYFTRPTRNTKLGVGDDAALISLSAGMELAISADMLVAGTHFFADCDAYQLGWKSLAVNISDMAAMGANAKWATLAIALPDINESWLAEFSRGFFACADSFNVDLIGGDTTRGSLTISVQIMGEVPIGKALRRDGAKVGDDIWVTGSLGDAAIGLAHLQNKLQPHFTLADHYLEYCLNALHQPQPRLALGLNLLEIAHSAIDISDGLLSDLGHILKAHNLGGAIYLNKLPCSIFTKQHQHEKQIQQYLLAGGDDYELCFTAPQGSRNAIEKIASDLNLPISLIGSIHEGACLIVLDNENKPISIGKTGYDHFA